MNRIEFLGKVYSPIVIPKFDGLATPKLKFAHELDRINDKALNINLTVFLELREVGGNSVFQIFNVLSKFKIDIVKVLTVEDLYDVWKKSANTLIKEYNKFEVSKGIRKTEINVGSKAHFQEFLSGLVKWFYSNQN